jgi:micrococcal nuclease
LNLLAAWWDRRRISIARSVNSITVSSSCHTLGGVKRAAAIMLAVAALSATGCRSETQSDSADGAHVSVVPVTGIADGDTIHVLLNGRRERLRLIGLDAPEIAHPDIAAECYGTTSARFTQRSLEGRHVRLEFDVERRDRFGRLLAYVFHRGELFNTTLVADGFAIEHSYPPNLAHQEEFQRAEMDARRHLLGLWGACEQ